MLCRQISGDLTWIWLVALINGKSNNLLTAAWWGSICRYLFGKLQLALTKTAQQQQLRRRNHVALDRLIKGPPGRTAESPCAAMPAVFLERRIPAEAAPAGPPTIAGPVPTADYTEANEIQNDRAGKEPV